VADDQIGSCGSAFLSPTSEAIRGPTGACAVAGADFVLAGLEQLKTAGLLEIEGDALSPAIGPMISRRSALAAGSALFPLIATVLVPSAAAAKSGDMGGKGGKGDKGDRGEKGDKGDKGGKGGKG
jgi:hypothetical protein